jgi:hypothetical protein
MSRRAHTTQITPSNLFKASRNISLISAKLAQVTGEWKAVEDSFNDEISGALVVVAYPKGKATIFTIERSRLDECWKNQLLPRLQGFYNNLTLTF